MTNPAQDAAAAALARIASTAGATAAPAAAPAPQAPADNSQLLREMMARMEALSQEVTQLRQAAAKAEEATKEDVRELREFCHRIPGSRVIICRKGPNGENVAEEHYFYNGKIVTKDPILQDALMEMVRSGGSPVFEGSTATSDLEAAQAQELVVRIAEESIDKLGAEAKAMQLGRA